MVCRHDRNLLILDYRQKLTSQAQESRQRQRFYGRLVSCRTGGDWMVYIDGVLVDRELGAFLQSIHSGLEKRLEIQI